MIGVSYRTTKTSVLNVPLGRCGNNEVEPFFGPIGFQMARVDPVGG